MVDVFNDFGYRNAAVVSDTMYYVDDSHINLELTVEEDRQFYYRNVTFTGNTKYSTDTLTKVLAIKRGDVYNKKRLESRLYMNQNGQGISSLYMDKGYLSFNPSRWKKWWMATASIFRCASVKASNTASAT